MNFFVLSLFVLLIAFSCKKKVADVNPDFIGSWSGSDSEASYSISIQSDSKAEYYKSKGFSETNITGNAKIKGDKLKIFTKKFRIDEMPKKVDESSGETQYMMVLDGIEFNCWK